MRKDQSGAVLAISLVLLTAITFLSMMGMQRSGLQTKIVANIQHKERAFHSSLNEQEFWFLQYATNPKDNILQLINSTDNTGAPAPVVLKDSDNIDPKASVKVNSSAIYVLPGINDVAFAIGEEAGFRRSYKFELNTTSSIRNRTDLNSEQRSGFKFSGLSISNNSL